MDGKYLYSSLFSLSYSKSQTIKSDSSTLKKLGFSENVLYSLSEVLLLSSLIFEYAFPRA